MKNNTLTITISIISIFLISLSSCSKDDPVIEIDQEEYNSAQVIFTRGNLENGQFTETDEKITVNFDRNGAPSSNLTKLVKGESYRMTINLFNGEENINQEIIDEADEHQFFFLGSPDGVFSYLYEDDHIGLKGILTVNSITEQPFDFNIILRHGLNKDHAAAQIWNNPQHVQAGGADDLNFTLKLQTVL